MTADEARQLASNLDRSRSYVDSRIAEEAESGMRRVTIEVDDILDHVADKFGFGRHCNFEALEASLKEDGFEVESNPDNWQGVAEYTISW